MGIEQEGNKAGAAIRMSKTGERLGRETFSSGGQKRPRSWNSRPQLLLKLENVLESHRRLVKQIVESHPCPQISDSTALESCRESAFLMSSQT